MAFMSSPPLLTKMETLKVPPTKKLPEFGDRYKEAPALACEGENNPKNSKGKKLMINNKLSHLSFLLSAAPPLTETFLVLSTFLMRGSLYTVSSSLLLTNARI